MRCPECGHDNLPGADECASCMGSLMQQDVPQANTPLEETIMVAPIASFQAPHPETTPEGTPLRAAIAQMQEQNVGYLLVTASDGRLVGIFTERDVLCK